MNTKETQQISIDSFQKTHPIKETMPAPAIGETQNQSATREYPSNTPAPASVESFARQNVPPTPWSYSVPTVYPSKPSWTRYPLSALLESSYPAYEHIPTLFPDTSYPGQGRPSELPCRRYCYLHDHNKNIVGVTDDTGDLVQHYEYDPYGRHTEVREKGLVDNPLRWSSEYWDDDLGLSFYNYRCYNPLDGQWLSRDPIGESGGVNLYGFVGNDPVSRIDLLGLDARTFATEEEAFSVASVMLVEAMEKKYSEDYYKWKKMNSNERKNFNFGYIPVEKEHGTVICCSCKENKKEYSIKNIVVDDRPQGGCFMPALFPKCESESTLVVYVHSHPRGAAGLSGRNGEKGDIDFSKNGSGSTPGGKIMSAARVFDEYINMEIFDPSTELSNKYTIDTGVSPYPSPTRPPKGKKNARDVNSPRNFEVKREKPAGACSITV